ncbi:MAG TPA: hypothetical protein VFA85_02365 [Terriglobales bacterium]|nr:hypothetical protein [Terriglobales bacterium]
MAHQFYWDFRRLIEGGSRWWLDKKKFADLEAELEKMPIELDGQQKARHHEILEEEIRSGRLPIEQKAERLRDIEEGTLFVTREWMREKAVEEARAVLKIPGEPGVFNALMQAETPERVREICAQASMVVTREVEPGVIKEIRVPAWPISNVIGLPNYLSQYASEFISAKKNPKFPKSDRKSTQLKKIWFLSRALSGALFGVSTRTAINLVGSQRPDQMFDKSRFGKPQRKRKKAMRK